MADIGVMPAPDGVTPNFDGMSSLQRGLIIDFAVTFFLATIFLVARLHTSAHLLKQIDLDDVFAFLAWGCALAFYIGLFYSMQFGYRKHLWDVRATQIQGYLDMLGYLALTYIWTPSITKLAMVALYHRINPDRVFRWTLYVVGLLILAYTVVFTYLFCGLCNPANVGSGDCLNDIAIAQAVLNIVSDAIIIIIPIPVIHHLNMPLKERLLVGVILGLGSAANIASIVRVTYVKVIAENTDFTFTQGSAALASTVEMNLGIMCNSLTRLKPFIKHHFPRLAYKLSMTGNLGPYIKQSNGVNDPVAWHHSSHSYKLNALAKRGTTVTGGRGDRGVDEGNRDIHVLNEYKVQYDCKSATLKDSSTDSTYFT